MTISSSTESQINPAARKQQQPADAKANPKTSAETKPSASSDAPAVVVDTPGPSAAEAKLAATAPAIETAADALKVAQSIGAAIAQGDSAIANGSPSTVSGLLSELEAA